MASIPQIPYKVPIINQAGFLSPAWEKWFRDVFLRIGGLEALSNTELEALNSDDITEIQADITAIEADVVELQAAVGITESLTQGRQL